MSVKTYLAVLFLILVGCSTTSEDQHPESDENNGVGAIERVFSNYYAPAGYKGINLDEEIANLRSRVVKAKSHIEKKEAVLNFFGSLKDIHSKPIFSKRKAVWLGLHIKKTSDGYFVAWIDPLIKKNQGFDINIGDRVLKIDDESIDDAISHVTSTTNNYSTSAFEQSFAEWFLTYRSLSEWPSIPKENSSIKISLIPRGKKKSISYELKWLNDDEHPPTARSKFWGKTRNSLVPSLGRVVWKNNSKAPFISYIFKRKNKKFGYIRFHTYNLSPKDRIASINHVKEFVKRLKKHSVSGLVIDQTGNGGGNFIFGFSLLSYFTTSPLKTPHQSYLVKDAELVGFGYLRDIYAEIKAFSEIHSDKRANDLMKDHAIFANNLNFVERNVRSAKDFYNFFKYFTEKPDFYSKTLLTTPHYQFQEWVHPNDKLAFDGPILLLVDELNISAAEYIAATLKDNGRAKLLGRVTSGAGGDQRVALTSNPCSYVKDNIWRFNVCLSKKEISGLKSLGLEGFSYTITLGHRIDKSGKVIGKIENQGIAPDITYNISYSDLVNQFSNYKQTILNSLDSL